MTSTHNTGKQSGPLSHTVEKKEEKSQTYSRILKNCIQNAFTMQNIVKQHP
jgi:hypothetical protein